MKYLLKIFIFLLFICFSFVLYKATPFEYKKIKFYFFSTPRETFSVDSITKKTDKKEIKINKFNSDKRNNSFSAKEVKNISLFIEKYKNHSAWSLRLKNIAQEAQNVFPSRKIQLKRRFPNTIEIYMEESLPIFLLLTEKGPFYPVFFDGNIGMALTSNQLLDLPIVRGEIFKRDKNLRIQVLNLLKLLPKEDIFSPKNISEIIYKTKQKSFIIYLIPHYFILEIKPLLKNKTIENINFVLNYLIQKEEKAAFIDAGFPEKIIVRRKRVKF